MKNLKEIGFYQFFWFLWIWNKSRTCVLFVKKQFTVRKLHLLINCIIVWEIQHRPWSLGKKRKKKRQIQSTSACQVTHLVTRNGKMIQFKMLSDTKHTQTSSVNDTNGKQCCLSTDDLFSSLDNAKSFIKNSQRMHLESFYLSVLSISKVPITTLSKYINRIAGFY